MMLCIYCSPQSGFRGVSRHFINNTNISVDQYLLLWLFTRLHNIIYTLIRTNKTLNKDSWNHLQSQISCFCLLFNMVIILTTLLQHNQHLWTFHNEKPRVVMSFLGLHNYIKFLFSCYMSLFRFYFCSTPILLHRALPLLCKLVLWKALHL
jgi:hypothetical protein